MASFSFVAESLPFRQFKAFKLENELVVDNLVSWRVAALMLHPIANISQTKVHQNAAFDFEIKQEITGFNVTMDDVVLMEPSERGQQLFHVNANILNIHQKHGNLMGNECRESMKRTRKSVCRKNGMMITVSPWLWKTSMTGTTLFFPLQWHNVN